jgi:hypothetical protein
MSTLFKNQKGFTILGYLLTVAISVASLVFNQSEIISLFQNILVNTSSKSQLAQVSGSTDIKSGLVGYWNMDSSDIKWAENTIIDRSGTGNHGTLSGLTLSTNSTTGKYGQAILFDGTNSINIPPAQTLNLSINNAFTYSLWLKNSSVPDNWQAVIYSDVLHQLAVNKDLLLIRPGGAVKQLVQYGPGGSPAYIVGQWYHLAVTYDGSMIYIYVNGSSDCSSCSLAATGTMSSISSLSIGKSFKGEIDEVRIYNRALSKDEITTLYNSESFISTGITPPAIPQGFNSPEQTTDSISLSWSANSEPDISGYKLYKNGGLFAVVQKDTLDYVIAGLSAGTNYSFFLKAFNTSSIDGDKTADLSVSTKANSNTTSSGLVTPAQYLASLSPPVFKSGHTLLPLTKWSWPYGFDMKVEMANWGYALDLGDADTESVAKLSDPNSEISKLISLAQQNPSKYKLFVGIPRVPVNMIPSSVYSTDSSGNLTKVFSPEVSVNDLNIMANYIKDNLKKITDKAPLAIIHNGGERYLGVCGFDCATWKFDPKVIAAKGSMSWGEYISRKKAEQELVFTNAVRSVSNAPYIWYFAGGNQSRSQTCSTWDMWDWDYRFMKDITDYPNNSLYYQEFNTGWTGHLKWTGCMGTSNNDMLSQALNAYGYAATFGKTLSYNWVNAGYGKYGFSDIERYYGFLKSYYVAGMIGGIAGYFDYPVDGFNATFDTKDPPHWVKQIQALSQVHAEFSYLEDILRGGDLLPGPDINERNPLQPAYEFRTGYNDTRVLARKMRGQKRWLISAWAADNISRRVNVAIPGIGTVVLDAKPTGSIYDARIVGGNMVLTQIDSGSMNPTPLNIPNSQPDSDSSAPYIPPPTPVTINNPEPVKVVTNTNPTNTNTNTNTNTTATNYNPVTVTNTVYMNPVPNSVTNFNSNSQSSVNTKNITTNTPVLSTKVQKTVQTKTKTTNSVVKSSSNKKTLSDLNPTTTIISDILIDGGTIEPFKALTFRELLLLYLKKVQDKTIHFLNDSTSRIYSGLKNTF